MCSVEYSVPLGNGSSTINTSRVWGPEQTPEGGGTVIILVRYHLFVLVQFLMLSFMEVDPRIMR